jgi:hypothetical protein
MILFWTCGLSIYFFLYIFKDKNADLRFIIFGSLFPVILDSSLYIFGLTNQNEYIGHSIFLTVSLFFIFMIATKRGSLLRSNSLLFSIGSFFYLVLSFTWLNQSIILYPLFQNSEEIFSLGKNYKTALGGIGFLYLIFKLRNIQILKEFINTGKFTY